MATRQGGYNGAGTIYAKLTIPNACAQVTIKRSVWVGNPNIIKTINGVLTSTVTVDPGGLYNLAAASTSPSTSFNYNNYDGSGDMVIDLYNPSSPSTQMYVLSNSTTGYRKVKLTATNSCGSYAEDFVFQLSSGMFKVYPNPVKDLLNIEFAGDQMGEMLPKQIRIFQESAIVPVKVVSVKEELMKENLKWKISINVSDLQRGVYYLHLTFDSDENERVEKIRVILN